MTQGIGPKFLILVDGSALDTLNVAVGGGIFILVQLGHQPFFHLVGARVQGCAWEPGCQAGLHLLLDGLTDLFGLTLLLVSVLLPQLGRGGGPTEDVAAATGGHGGLRF